MNASSVKVRVKDGSTFLDFTRGRSKRFFQPETLAEAIEGMMSRGDSWLNHALRQNFAGMTIATFNLHLLWENAYALAYRATVAAAQGKGQNLLMVVAKNHQEHSERLAGELEVLKTLSQRFPAGVMPVHAEGTLFLPERRTRDGRPVLACLRAWPGPCVATELRENGQYVLVGEERRLLTKAESQAYAERLATLLFQTFDPLTRDGPSLQSLHWGDVLCRTFRNSLHPAMAHCPRLTRYRSLQAYLKGALLWEPEKDSGVFPLQHLAPERLLSVLKDSLGEQLAQESVRRLSSAGGDVSLPVEYVQSLRALTLPE